MSDERVAGGAVAPVRERLRQVREESGPHWVALVVAIVAGLALSSVHWLGLVAGGALVGLVAASLRRALLAGLGFGLLVLGVWMVVLALPGSLGKVVAMGEIAGVGAVIGLVAPVFGSLARGVI